MSTRSSDNVPTRRRKVLQDTTTCTPVDWQKDFTWLWRGSAASQVGTMCTAIAGPLLALDITGSAAVAGCVTACGTLSSLLLYIPAGLIADRFDRRRIMLVSQWARLIAGTALIVAITLEQVSATVLIIAVFTDGALATLYNTAEFATIPHIVPSKRLLPSAVAKSESRNHVALFLGRPIGGTLYGLHQALPYAAHMALSAFSIAALAGMRTNKLTCARRHRERRPPFRRFREDLSWILSKPYTKLVLIVCAITNFSFQIVFLYLVYKAEKQGTDSYLIGFLMAMSGLGGAIGSIVAPRAIKKLSPFQVLLYSVCFWISLPLTALLVDHVELGMVIWGGVSFMGANLNVALYVYLMTHAPGERLGQITSLNGFLLRGATALGALCGGYIIAADGAQLAFAIITVAISALAVFVGVAHYRSHSHSATEPPTKPTRRWWPLPRFTDS